MNRPNILFVMVDQLRPDHAGFMPEALFRTPVLQSLAQGGTVFSNCQSVNPVCMPARAALLTGRYTHQIGTLGMSGDLPFDLPTFPQALQKAGYWTALAGKLHVLQAWPWGQPRGEGIPLARLSEKMKTLGFDWLWESAGKQLALKNHCDWCEHLQARGILEEVRDYVASAGPNNNQVDATLDADGKPWPFDEADHVDVVTADKALQALRERPRDRPFFLEVSFCSPHKPFDPPQRFLDAEPHEATDDFTPGPGGEILPDEMKKILWRLRRAYRATVRLIDEQMGRLFDELRAQGVYDNTLILFTSDHGEMMGDHGLVQKQTYYRESLTVPTLVRDPCHPRTRVHSSPVELTDLTATILDAAGLNASDALSESWPAYRNVIPCRSLLSALSEDTPLRAFSFSESGTGWQCLQSQTRKYVRWPDADTPGIFHERFFDLHTDPHETINLHQHPSEQPSLQRHRDHLDWLLACTPPAQSRWAPFGKSCL